MRMEKPGPRNRERTTLGDPQTGKELLLKMPFCTALLRNTLIAQHILDYIVYLLFPKGLHMN